MRNSVLAVVILMALAATGCGKKEQASAPATAPSAEVAAPAMPVEGTAAPAAEAAAPATDTAAESAPK